ncbi:MAG TPA: T9SS type A sorting domain-containing protein [Saprospiraceae bacterium]|nr:T9SS type A sorting domain-containing protein [Lewinellaceae bacterium]HPK09831.1 T9SS type A sorting domain-containing protein [Saprospiraceae bacterium]HPQ22195.1 T9SS type A sorting domain-containing protein [Saprospiraceae bacterium]
MKTILSTFTFILLLSSLLAQTKSSKIVYEDFLDNQLLDLDLKNERFYVLSNHYCPTLDPNVFESCSALHTGETLLELETSILLENKIITNLGNRSILATKDGLIFAGTKFKIETGRQYRIADFNSTLQQKNLYSIGKDTLGIADVIGITNDNDSYYIYGIYQDINKTFWSYIVKTDTAYKVIWEKKYKRTDVNNGCSDLQLTQKGELIYINKYDLGGGANNDDGIQIIKLDTSGRVLDSLEIPGYYIDSFSNPPVLSAHDGSVYVFTKDYPYPYIFLQQGVINKYSENMDTLLWSLRLPFDNVFDERTYRVVDFLEAENGDILVCGQAFDASPHALIDTQDNSWNGFMARISPAGEIRWIRVYRVPHDHPLLPIEEYGRYHQGRLWHMHEMADGRIVLGGTLDYTQKQLLEVIGPAGEVRSFIWLLMVNGDGCLDNEECQEVIVIDGEVHKAEPIFPIGTSWTYEYFPININPNQITHSYITYTVSDSTTVNDTTIYSVSVIRAEDTIARPAYQMIQGDHEIWFWDESLQKWQVNYDFNAVTSYPTQYFDQYWQTEFETTVSIDSIYYYDFGDWGLQPVQNVSIDPNGTVEEPLEQSILENCGSLYGGLKLDLGRGGLIDSFDPHTGKLRCFERGGFFHNFDNPPFPKIACDSVWVEIKSSTTHLEENEIKIFPNPNKGQVKIQGDFKNINYRLFDMTGKLIQRGKSFDHSIEVPHPGIFILEIEMNDSWYKKKIIRID